MMSNQRLSICSWLGIDWNGWFKDKQRMQLISSVISVPLHDQLQIFDCTDVAKNKQNAAAKNVVETN